MKLALLVFSLLALSIAARAADGQTVLAPGLFSYQAPPGWTVKETSFSKYKMCFAPPANGFAANLNIVIENASGSLKDYVSANLKAIEAMPMFSNVTVVDQQPFKTTTGIDGQRVVIKDTMSKLNLQQTFYFFDVGPNSKMVVTGSCLVGDEAADAPLFDSAIKSLTLE